MEVRAMKNNKGSAIYGGLEDHFCKYEDQQGIEETDHGVPIDPGDHLHERWGSPSKAPAFRPFDHNLC